MAFILSLETSTKNCSVSISKDAELLYQIEQASDKYSHGEQLHRFIEDALRYVKMELKDMDAIAVSKGPGSYTGLRIGVSAAKGLCYAHDLPLISVSSLAVLARNVETDFGVIVPVIDARRMEVYSAVFDSDYKPIREVRAEVIDASSFAEFRQKGPVILVGDGAEKTREILTDPVFEFVHEFPTAEHMAILAYEKYKKSDIEDVAYFEPFYLKNFVATPQKKKL